MIDRLVKIANMLDEKGMFDEADILTDTTKKLLPDDFESVELSKANLAFSRSWILSINPNRKLYMLVMPFASNSTPFAGGFLTKTKNTNFSPLIQVLFRPKVLPSPWIRGSSVVGSIWRTNSA